jgi:hypothetical protein
MCSHAVKIVYDDVDEIDPFVKPLQISTFIDLLTHGHFIPTLSIVFRRSSLPDIPSWYTELLSGDIPLIYLVTHNGKNYHMDEVMGVKQKHTGSITQKPDRSKKSFNEYRYKKEIFLYKNLNEYFGYQYKKFIDPILAKYYFKLMLINLENRNFSESINDFFKSFHSSPQTLLKRLGGEILIKLSNY